VFGMLSATIYHMNKGRDFLAEAHIAVEWLAFITINVIGWLGPNLPSWYSSA
jgi:hypothetical protein